MFRGHSVSGAQCFGGIVFFLGGGGTVSAVCTWFPFYGDRTQYSILSTKLGAAKGGSSEGSGGCIRGERDECAGDRTALGSRAGLGSLVLLSCKSRRSRRMCVPARKAQPWTCIAMECTLATDLTSVTPSGALPPAVRCHFPQLSPTS